MNARRIGRSGRAALAAFAVALSTAAAAAPVDTASSTAASASKPESADAPSKTTPSTAARPSPVDTLPRHAAPHFNFVVVGVADMARSLAFYGQVVGLHERGRAQPDLRHYEVIVGFDDAPLTTGISLKYRDGPPNPRGNGSSALNFVVAGLEARVARVEALGGKVTMPYARHASKKLDYGYATVEDPDGNAIELVEYFARPAQATTAER